MKNLRNFFLYLTISISLSAPVVLAGEVQTGKCMTVSGEVQTGHTSPTSASTDNSTLTILTDGLGYVFDLILYSI